MISEKFTVEIISPVKSIIKSETQEVVIPAYEGEMGILKDHIPLITFLRPGIIRISSEKEKKFYVEEGTVEFSNNQLLILTPMVNELSLIDKSFVQTQIDEVQKKIINDKVSDKEKYFLSYKLDTLKSLN